MFDMRKRKCLLIVFVIPLIISLLYCVCKMATNSISHGLPHIQMVVDSDRSAGLPNGHFVSANYHYQSENGSLGYFDIPSLQGIWQLDESYASKATVIISENTRFLSFFCAIGRLSKTPLSVSVARFDTSVIENSTNNSLTWDDGELLELKRKGNSFRTCAPIVEGVYVLRTVWENGVLEKAWLVMME